MNYAISYSFGKDSTLAMDKIVRAGGTPVCLVATYNSEMERSWIHGVNPPLMRALADSLRIPLLLSACGAENYEAVFEDTLLASKNIYRAEAVVYGDIDVEEHRCWDCERAENAGLTAVLPLWQQERESCVREFLDLGYTALIKCIDNTLLSRELLGRPLDPQMLDYFAAQGVDLCGENGEYHTVAVGGRLFKKPLSVKTGDYFEQGKLSAVDIVLRD